MKKTLFFSFAAALLMTGCAKEGLKTDLTEGADNLNYLSVNVVATPTTRAVEDEANYEDGTKEENTVTSVRFYFFDATGNPAPVKANGDSFYDWTDGKVEQGKPKPNIDKMMAATLVIETKKGDKIPTKIAAVLNPTFSGANTSLATLKDRIENYAELANKKNQFVMFSSVFAKGGAEVCAADITSANLCKTEAVAKANPVNIYVERNMAKVRVNALAEDVATNGKVALKDKDGKAIVIEGKQVYAKLYGWDLTATTDNAYLGKHINPSWKDEDLFGTDEPWNWDPFYRSFWAQNTSTATNTYSSYTAHVGKEQPFTSTQVLYTNENAEFAANPFYNTKVIIPAMLCYEDDKPLTLAKFHGVTFTGTNFTLLKKAVLEMLATQKGFLYYTDTQDGDDVGKRQIVESDIDFVTAAAADMAEDVEEGKRYYVYAQLTAEAQKLTWYASLAEDAAPIKVAEVNETLKSDWAKAMIWDKGATYYYHTIKHLGGKPGVVRNHIYDMTISKICGLGTPVYDPEEVIYPEKPDPEEDTYIAAQINILSWRLVNNYVELEW